MYLDIGRNITPEEQEEIKENFKEKDPIWRIEAVINDGSWYDVKKWAKVSKVKPEDVESWIDNNKDKVVKSRNGVSYRTTYEHIMNWYEREAINIEESIVPKNFPPRVWCGKTETDFFLEAPRRRVGTMTFYAQDKQVLDKVAEILKGVAKIYPEDNNGRYRAFSLSAIHMRNMLSKGLSENEYNSLEIKTRASLYLRELIDFPEEWLEKALPFYSIRYAPNILKSSMSTISIYIPEESDLKTQTLLWVINAIRKYNEESGVPFLGYLSTVLRHWPYDLPDEYLGKELARFQRGKREAITKITNTAGNDSYDEGSISVAEIASEMEISLEEFITLNKENEAWMAEKNATTLNWEGSYNEKRGKPVGVAESAQSDPVLLYNMSISLVQAAVDTEEWESAYHLITQMDSDDIDPNLSEKLDASYVSKFREYLTKNIKKNEETYSHE